MTEALAIPVGANRTFPGFRGPVEPDGSFTYAPPPETDPSVEGPTYADLDLDVPEQHRSTPVHLDPEFPEYPYGQAYTYGAEATTTAGALRELSAGDLLFFYATLDYAGDEPPQQDWVNPYWGAYLIGHFELARDPLPRSELLALPDEEIEFFESSVHFHRPSFDAQVVVLGNPERSQLYDRAVPLGGRQDPSQPNRIVTELSSDSGDPGWRRRLMFFDEPATQHLLAGIENDKIESLVAGEPTDPSGDGQAYLVLEEAPGAASFDRYLRLPEGLFELSEWIQHHVESDELETELFATLAFVATGWSTRVLTDVWRASIRELATAGELSDQMTTLLQGAISDAGPTWPHPRRRDLADEPGRAAEEIASTFSSFRENVAPTVSDLVLEASQTEDPFHTMFETLADQVHAYDRRVAFHQLRVWYHVLGLDEAAPARLRPGHVDFPEARRGFEAVMGREFQAVDESEAQACLDALVDHAERQLSRPRRDAVFEVQRALASFQPIPEADEDEDSEGGRRFGRLLGLGRSR